MELKAKDEVILSALLSCGSISEAEKKTGVSRSTIYKRLADDDFKAEYDKRRGEALGEACNTLQSTLIEAVTTIKDIMTNKKNSPQVRLNACSLILQNSLKYAEQIEILTRIERLEKNIGGEQIE